MLKRCNKISFSCINLTEDTEGGSALEKVLFQNGRMDTRMHQFNFACWLWFEVACRCTGSECFLAKGGAGGCNRPIVRGTGDGDRYGRGG